MITIVFVSDTLTCVYFAQIEILIKTQLKRNIMSEEPEVIQPEGESLVKHCPICGVKFGDVFLTYRWLKCDSCEMTFQVKSKTGE